MNEWFLLLAAACIGSVVSLIGGIYLLYGGKGAQHLQKYAVPFAAGALLAASFYDLLPEALEHAEVKLVLSAALGGFVVFFLLERFLHWFHHHHEHEPEAAGGRSTASLVIIGDTLHNFIDGMAIAAAFLVSPATGIVTTLAVAAHEIPQEIGDFGLLLSKGMARRQVLLVNVFSALATVLGAVLIYALGGVMPISEPLLLAVTAGFFIYIAASDIIPTIHAQTRPKVANIQAVILLLGILVVSITTVSAHQFIEHREVELPATHEVHDHEAEEAVHSHD